MAVEYLQGQTSAAPAEACGQRPTTVDETGRMRAVWVSRGTLDGGRPGDLMHRVYAWTGDQLTSEDVCLLGQATPRRTQYTSPGNNPGYDQLLRLTSAMRPTGNWAAAGGTFEQRSYGYDARGNRTSEGHDQGLSPTGPLYNFTYASGAWQKDQVLGKYDTLSEMRHDYSYDEDGKVTRDAEMR